MFIVAWGRVWKSGSTWALWMVGHKPWHFFKGRWCHSHIKGLPTSHINVDFFFFFFFTLALYTSVIDTNPSEWQWNDKPSKTHSLTTNHPISIDLFSQTLKPRYKENVKRWHFHVISYTIILWISICWCFSQAPSSLAVNHDTHRKHHYRSAIPFISILTLDKASLYR